MRIAHGIIILANLLFLNNIHHSSSFAITPIQTTSLHISTHLKSTSSISTKRTTTTICHETTTSTTKEEKWKNNMPTINGPPMDTKPDYNNIHGPFGKQIDSLFLTIFRTQMAEKVGVDSKLPKDDYEGLMELTTALNARYSDRREVQRIAQEVLKSLFPSWLLSQFIVMFANPFPEFSAKLNALATATFGTWLMGECTINDCAIDNNLTGKNQGVLVKRCRFLEESNCASVCVNSCKIPTQKFFLENMGVPLTMTPDYETGECQFAFGLTPNEREMEDALNTPCLKRCPSLGGMRKWHDGGASDGISKDMKNSLDLNDGFSGGKSQCFLMENDD